jgi:GNAT superfamily N-acetyltransferase
MPSVRLQIENGLSWCATNPTFHISPDTDNRVEEPLWIAPDRLQRRMNASESGEEMQLLKVPLTFEILSTKNQKFNDILSSLQNQVPQSEKILLFALFGMERLRPCDEVIIAYQDNLPVGILTIAPRGETYDGNAELVGVYVLLTHRRQGIASYMIDLAVKRCQKRELLLPVYLKAVLPDMQFVIKNLPKEILDEVQVC